MVQTDYFSLSLIIGIILILSIFIITIYITNLQKDIQTYKTELTPCSNLFPFCTEENFMYGCTKFSRCDRKEFNTWCRNRGTNPECMGTDFVDWCINSKSIETSIACQEYCLHAPEDTEGVCDIREYCLLTGNYNPAFEKCKDICSLDMITESPSLIGTCKAVDFNEICFNSDDTNIINACDISCDYPETFPDSIDKYIYCTKFSKYKSLSPCYTSLLNKYCYSNINVINSYCDNNNTYCSYLKNEILEDRYINKCDCECLSGGDYCKLPQCKNSSACN